MDLKTPAVRVALSFLADSNQRAWLAGGAIRDLLQGKEPHDIDLVTEGDPIGLARAFADTIGGSFFAMSEEFSTCRVVCDSSLSASLPVGTAGQAGLCASREGGAIYDFAAIRGKTIEEDLRARDFTVDAMAVELPGGGPLIDPVGGAADLAAGRLVQVNDQIFKHDPLRLLRAVRLEKTGGLLVVPALAELIRSQAALVCRPAAERVFAELTRILEAPGTAVAIRRLDELNLLEFLLPEVSALKGIKQNEYHHLDVYEHTLANVEELGRIIEDPALFFPGQAEKIKKRCQRRIAGDASWRFVMGFAALMHDIAKPYCKFIDNDGQIRFFEHDRRGGKMASDILARFKASAAVTQAVSFLVSRHMRFEGLIQEGEPSQRARLRYLRSTEPFSPELIMLSVSDRLSVRGPRVTEADIERHLALAREMMEMSFAEEEAEPVMKLVSGDDLTRELGLRPGPLIGKILNRIEEEQRLGNVSSRQEALALANKLAAKEF